MRRLRRHSPLVGVRSVPLEPVGPTRGTDLVSKQRSRFLQSLTVLSRASFGQNRARSREVADAGPGQKWVRSRHCIVCRTQQRGPKLRNELIRNLFNCTGELSREIIFMQSYKHHKHPTAMRTALLHQDNFCLPARFPRRLDITWSSGVSDEDLGVLHAAHKHDDLHSGRTKLPSHLPTP